MPELLPTRSMRLNRPNHCSVFQAETIVIGEVEQCVLIHNIFSQNLLTDVTQTDRLQSYPRFCLQMLGISKKILK